MPQPSEDWACSAYGLAGESIGARCFFPRTGEPRTCMSEAECGSRLTSERQRIFRRLNELAAGGKDETFTRVSQEIASPDDLL